jgi:hypothetical protein
MAVALNVFKTVRGSVTLPDSNGKPIQVYTPEVGYTGIVLMAQITNISGATAQVTVTTYNPNDLTNTEIELLKNFTVPAYDAVSATMGKLVIAEGTALRLSASNATALKYTLSILESAK